MSAGGVGAAGAGGRSSAPTAALAGVPTGLQALGVWAGRRQLFIRFAGEAETATMYLPRALAGELKRIAERTSFHSIAITGRDAAGNAAFLAATFHDWTPTAPVMLDTDGQRPDAIAGLRPYLSMVQVSVDFSGPDAMVERAMDSLGAAAGTGCHHALVLLPHEETSDVQILRAIERGRAASGGTIIVIHPAPTATSDAFAHLDRRWAVLLEKASAVHNDVRVTLRIPPPAGMR
ncbi:MAG TPA: hypothetical protein VKA84_05275 [Gemmatimonadaceae bacterium]|nr:hypothetical protein [Gemmatimonadaceae bacterium]